jgi:hypothetical protein
MSFLKTCLAEFVDPFDNIREEKDIIYPVKEESAREGNSAKRSIPKHLQNKLKEVIASVNNNR